MFYFNINIFSIKRNGSELPYARVCRKVHKTEDSAVGPNSVAQIGRIRNRNHSNISWASERSFDVQLERV